MKYEKFLESKLFSPPAAGLEPKGDLNTKLYPFQADLVRWALRRGRAALFCDCGLGKTPMQLEWARHVPGRVLILAPLAVAKQTIREADKFGIDGIEYARDGSESEADIVITNYEMLEHFDPSEFNGIVLDESSILKSYDGKTRTQIIQSFRDTPYRLACTATPAPNDYLELGNHSEFLGLMDRWTMRSMFFVHDSQMHGPGHHSGDVRNYRLKKHGEDMFWEWVCSWAVMMRTPSDLGYDDDGFNLPPIHYLPHEINSDEATPGFLFPMAASTLHERIAARSATTGQRLQKAIELVNGDSEQWIVWCGLNKESNAANRAIDGAVEVAGSDSIDHKENTLLAFAAGDVRVLVTKPSIAGFGMNFQNCKNVLFLGISDSWETYYQAVRRCWRFGQDQEVNVHVITADIEGKVVANIQKKETAAIDMHRRITKAMSIKSKKEIAGDTEKAEIYHTGVAEGEGWKLHLGDSVEVMKSIPSDSLDYSVFSPPFMSLFIYSDSPRDVGNSKDDVKFFEHLGMIYTELLRAMKPGRLVSVHTSDIPRTLNWDGFMGIRDFRGEMIRVMESIGFNYHAGTAIWKNPVVEMQRTKALGLLYKQLRKDSTRSRMGTADYISTFRKPGDNATPVEHTEESFPLDQWQQWASPVWMDINQSNTIQKRSAREAKDEKHVCPLQLDVIERCIRIWSNPGDLVFSPFAGIGSEGYVALQHGRRFLGVELKESYWKQAKANLAVARQHAGELFRGGDMGGGEQQDADESVG